MRSIRSYPGLIHESKIRDSATDSVLWKSKVVCDEDKLAGVFASTLEFSGFNKKKVLNLVDKKFKENSKKELEWIKKDLELSHEAEKNKVKEYFKKNRI